MNNNEHTAMKTSKRFVDFIESVLMLMRFNTHTHKYNQLHCQGL